MQAPATPLEPAAPLTGAEFARAMHGLVETGARLALAVSGGADSLCLALLASDWARTNGTQVLALIVDHGLRDGSADEAKRTSTRLTSLGIDNRILTWLGGNDVTGALQERARDARYELMGAACREAGIRHLVLAHHQDDQAETFVMRLAKGSGLYGLGAMARVSKRDGLTLLRPLLDVPKARLVATLRDRDQDWIEDPSNQNPAFARVRVRGLLKELDREGLNAARFAAAAASCARISEGLEGHVRAALQDWTTLDKGRTQLALKPFMDAPKPLQIKVLSRLIQGVNGSVYAPKADKLERLCDWICGGDGGPARTLGGCLVRRIGGDLVMCVEKPRSLPLAPAPKMTYIQGTMTAPRPARDAPKNAPQLAIEGVSALT